MKVYYDGNLIELIILGEGKVGITGPIYNYDGYGDIPCIGLIELSRSYSFEEDWSSDPNTTPSVILGVVDIKGWNIFKNKVDALVDYLEKKNKNDT